MHSTSGRCSPDHIDPARSGVLPSFKPPFWGIVSSPNASGWRIQVAIEMEAIQVLDIALQDLTARREIVCPSMGILFELHLRNSRIADFMVRLLILDPHIGKRRSHGFGVFVRGLTFRGYKL